MLYANYSHKLYFAISLSGFNAEKKCIKKTYVSEKHLHGDFGTTEHLSDQPPPQHPSSEHAGAAGDLNITYLQVLAW